MGAIEEEVEEIEQTRSYCQTGLTIYEGLALKQLNLGFGDSHAVFKLDLDVSIQFIKNS